MRTTTQGGKVAYQRELFQAAARAGEVKSDLVRDAFQALVRAVHDTLLQGHSVRLGKVGTIHPALTPSGHPQLVLSGGSRLLEEAARHLKGTKGRAPRKAAPKATAAAPPSRAWDGRVQRYQELRAEQVRSDPSRLARFVGHHMSEKIDGWFCVVSGGQARTKGGVVLPAPDDWVAPFRGHPPVAGELVLAGRDATDVARLRGGDPELWRQARLHAFDLPMHPGGYSARREELARVVRSMRASHVTLVPATVVRSVQHLLDTFHKITTHPGEGLVLTAPDVKYEDGPTRLRAKLKARLDDEAVVTGHTDRSLLVTYKGVAFRLSRGLTGEHKKRLPRAFPLGSKVKFAFRALSRSGMPLDPRLIGARDPADAR